MKAILFVCLSLCVVQSYTALNPSIACHGGAGIIPKSRYEAKYNGSIKAVTTGYSILRAGKSALQAVEEAIHVMESNENFNAGYGAVLTSNGEVELDACIMDGSNMKVGAVTGVKDILHPITLARRVMEKTFYNFLGAEGAMKLAKAEGFQFLKPGALVTAAAKKSLEVFKITNDPAMKETVSEGGTVGCVAIDSKGNFAAGTSTGGLTGKMTGRIGDTPIVGAGTYADNQLGALSATGTGEVIMKAVLVFDILKRVNLTGIDIQSSAESALREMMMRYKEDAGVIGFDKNGNVVIALSSPQMSWAYQNNDVYVHYGVEPGDIFLGNKIKFLN